MEELEFVTDFDPGETVLAEVVACWTDVTNAGGAVGFVPPVAMDDVLPLAERTLAAVRHGYDRMVLGRAGGRVAALAFLVGSGFELAAHRRTVKRVMVHPDFQGRGYGLALMREVERVGRELGLQQLTLSCRGGTGNDLFYKKCGYTEFGRLPKGLRLSEDDYRDDIYMALVL
jgi:GNAT superfamily N-acetyltransferase